jgi:hypothetical protein
MATAKKDDQVITSQRNTSPTKASCKFGLASRFGPQPKIHLEDLKTKSTPKTPSHYIPPNSFVTDFSKPVAKNKGFDSESRRFSSALG